MAVILFTSSCMASTFEGGRQPDLEHAVDEPFAEEVSREAEDVQIIMTSAHFGSEIVVARCGSHAVHLVGCDAHADSGSAHQNSTIGFASTNFMGYNLRDIGIVDRAFFVRAEIEGFVTKLFHKLQDLVPNRSATMITSDGNTHNRYLLFRAGWQPAHSPRDLSLLSSSHLI